MLFLIQARNEASRDLKQLQTEIGSVVSAASKTTADVALPGGLDNLAGMLPQLTSVEGALGAVGTAAGVAGVAIGGIALAKVAYDMGEVGAQSLKMSAAFDSVAASAGLMGRELLTALRTASAGTISDQQLMTVANRAIGLGVADSVDEFTGLMEVARAKAAETGRSVTEAFDWMVTGIGRASPQILDNVNIVLDADTVFQNYARSIGTTAAALDDAQRKQAVLNAVLQQNAGGMSETVAAAAKASEAYERLGASMENLKATLGVAFVPLMSAVVDTLAGGVGAINSTVQTLSGDITQSLDELDAKIIQAAASIEKLKGYGRQDDQITYAINGYRDQIVMLEQARNQLLGNATAAATVESAMQRIGSATAATKTEAWGAVSAWQNFEGATRNAAGAQSQAGAIISMVTGQMAAQAAQANATASQLRGMWVAAAGALGAEAALSGFKNQEQELNTLMGVWSNYGRMTQEQIEFKKAEWLQQQNKLLQEQIDAPQKAAEAAKAQMEMYRKANDAARDTGRENMTIGEKLAAQLGTYPQKSDDAAAGFDRMGEALKKAVGGGGGGAAGPSILDDIQSKVQGILSQSLSLDVGVDPAQFLPREDAINENARRLADIMQNGLKGQSWLDEFKTEVPGIFDEIAASGDIQGSAARILQEFQQGLRPELIDKDAVKARVKAMLVGDASMAQLAQEIAAELSAELGVSLAQAQQAAGAVLGVGGDSGAATTGSSLADGLASATDGKAIVEQIAAQMDGAADRMRLAGSSAGTIYGLGFMSTVETSLAAPLIALLVTLVTPGVVAQFAAQNGATGAK